MSIQGKAMRLKTRWKIYRGQVHIIEAIYIFALGTIKMQVFVMVVMLITA